MWQDFTDNIIQLLSYNAKEPLIFSSGLFIFLFLGFLVIFHLVKHNYNLRFAWVALFSFYFYYKSSGFYFLLLLFVSVADWVIALQMYHCVSQNRKKLMMQLSILMHLSLLGYFKYTNFLIEIFSAITTKHIEFQHIFLPIGISFFTFQSMSYVIDVYRGKLTPLKRLLDYTFFVSFFPQLVAGPIVRAIDFAPQIYKPTFVSKEMYARAVFLITTGLFKKAVISDYISLNFVDRIFDAPHLYTGFENLMGVYGYALQIYCDFSGYSDMAIGIALLLGFHFNINFDSPYKSASITEFWRRWHISLSSWLKDYLYISLGGNRKGKIFTYLNLFITMVIGGLWHGASLKFVLWGALHGISLVFHKLIMSIFPKMKIAGSEMKLGSRILGAVITFHIVCLGWIFFRASSFDLGIEVLKRIFTAFHPEILPQFLEGYRVVSIFIVFGYVVHFAPKKWGYFTSNQLGKLPVVVQATLIAALIIFIFQIKSADIQPFIYFQF